MKIIEVKSIDELASTCAEIIEKQVKEKPSSVLGLATGSSPIGTYRELINKNLDFSTVATFNLDEYCGLNKEHNQSYYYFMHDKLFNHIKIKSQNINFPDNMETYDEQIQNAGGIDLQLLGIGYNGHIGFNEPDAVFHNKTHKVELAQSTIEANKRFFDSINDVPRTAITMGIGTIMAARKIVLIAGADKAAIIKKLQSGVVDPQVPASILNYHPDCTIIIAKV